MKKRDEVFQKIVLRPTLPSTEENFHWIRLPTHTLGNVYRCGMSMQKGVAQNS
jgi:hypothetical protein